MRKLRFTLPSTAHSWYDDLETGARVQVRNGDVADFERVANAEHYLKSGRAVEFDDADVEKVETTVE